MPSLTFPSFRRIPSFSLSGVGVGFALGPPPAGGAAPPAGGAAFFSSLALNGKISSSFGSSGRKPPFSPSFGGESPAFPSPSPKSFGSSGSSGSSGRGPFFFPAFFPPSKIFGNSGSSIGSSTSSSTPFPAFPSAADNFGGAPIGDSLRSFLRSFLVL